MAGTEADDNNNSLVLRLVWQEATFLLTGDVEAEAEELLLDSAQPLAAGVLKVAHHGGVLDRLSGLGDVTVLRTDEQGTIELVTDGARLWVQTER